MSGEPGRFFGQHGPPGPKGLPGEPGPHGELRQCSTRQLQKIFCISAKYTYFLKMYNIYKLFP